MRSDSMVGGGVRAAYRGAAVMAGLVLASACADRAPTTPATPAAPALDRGGMEAMGAMAGAGDQMKLQEGALYVAELKPLNPRVQQQMDPDPETGRGVTRGKAYFRVTNGMLHAVVDVAGAEPADAAFPEGLHPQHIHASSQCPTASADTNGDGIVDVIEGLPFYGPILVPLDADLANLGFELSFPFGQGERGTYHYEASASVAAIDAALTTAFPNVAANHSLDLATRHVVIHGVDLATPLPSTVQTLNFPDGSPIPPQLTLPVACGEIHLVR